MTGVELSTLVVTFTNGSKDTIPAVDDTRPGLVARWGKINTANVACVELQDQ